jgi:hypothetical protein
MGIYYLSYKVAPTKKNFQYNIIAGSEAYCFFKARSADVAFRKSKFEILKGDWEIIELSREPIEVAREDFLEKDIGLKHFDNAVKMGHSIIYMSWAKDGKTQMGPIPCKSFYSPKISDYLKEIRKNRNKGRCLHYESGNRCNEIVKAHSIQKGGLLSKIATNGHVYVIDTDFGSLKRNSGNPSYKKIGINNASTFLGFCKEHDNKLFKLIDNEPLLPTPEQIFLYAYRSLCREIFVKENALNVLKEQLKNKDVPDVIYNLFSDMQKGTRNGFNELKRHKNHFDDVAANIDFSKIKYTLFKSKKELTHTFSGLFYPDFDFIGRELQDISNLNSSLELITFCSAPTTDGWGFLFTWHETSSKICTEFMRSLATAIHEGKNLGDLLFRLAVGSCENHCMSPNFWENLAKEKQQQILDFLENGLCMFSEKQPTQLMEGLENICLWDFYSVIDDSK